MHLPSPPSVAKAAVHSKAVALMLFFLVIAASIVCGGPVFDPCFVIKYFVSQFCKHLDGKEKAGCFNLTVFPVSCDSQ